MKTILLLGGSAQQVVAVDTARRLGYRTVLCDYLPDNPGQFHADKFYLVSTTDMETVLEVAQNEKIDGILAYASDPAAPTAAFVAEKLGLPTNPYVSVDILCNKDKFRCFLKCNGFNAPMSGGYSNVDDAMHDSGKFHLPIIVKPVDSSGSKGATVLRSWDGLATALEHAFAFSRRHRVIVEEFIEKKHPYLIGGDIFIVNGRIVLWGLLNCHRDSHVNPLVPVGKSYPLMLDDNDRGNVERTLQGIVDKLGIRFGAVNVELIVSVDGRVWPIDIGPRNGGNMIPDLLGMIFGIDVVEMTVKAAMEGGLHDFSLGAGIPYYATHNLHSDKNGFFKAVSFSAELEKKIVRCEIYKKPGDKVEYFDNASKAIGIVFMKFENMENMMRILGNISEHIIISFE